MKSTLSWMFTTWLALIALQALTTRTAPSRVGDMLSDINGLLERALDPNVPAIPDLRAGAAPAASSPSTSTSTTGGSVFGPPSTPRLPVPAGG